MSVLDQIPSASLCRPRRRRSVCIILILLVVGITILTIDVKPSRRAALKYFWTNDSTSEPHPPNEGAPPPLVHQNFRQKQEKHPREHQHPFQGVQLEDGLLEAKSQNKRAGKLLNNEILKKVKQNPPKTCQPKSHIVFLKTHKTASSTVQNILYRYGDNRGLIFALPPKGVMLSYPQYFTTDSVEKKGLTHFDILCNHMRFRKSELKKLMPEDSFYFSIIRHPVSFMESAFMFYKNHSTFHKFPSLDDFLDNDQDNKSINANHGHNFLAYDFGYDNTPTANTSDLETIVNKVIAGIEQDFHLILITDYFDESMILLKHALCWSLEDVVSFKINSRSNQSHTLVSNMTAEKIKRWNILDWRIYEHFNTTFWHKVRRLVGEEEMKLEVSQLKELRAKLSSTCLEGGHAVNVNDIKNEISKPPNRESVVLQGYNLNPNLNVQTKEKCQKMITAESKYKRFLYEKQFGKKTKLKVKKKNQ